MSVKMYKFTENFITRFTTDFENHIQEEYIDKKKGFLEDDSYKKEVIVKIFESSEDYQELLKKEFQINLDIIRLTKKTKRGIINNEHVSNFTHILDPFVEDDKDLKHIYQLFSNQLIKRVNDTLKEKKVYFIPALSTDIETFWQNVETYLPESVQQETRDVFKQLTKTLLTYSNEASQPDFNRAIEFATGDAEDKIKKINEQIKLTRERAKIFKEQLDCENGTTSDLKIIKDAQALLHNEIKLEQALQREKTEIIKTKLDLIKTLQETALRPIKEMMGLSKVVAEGQKYSAETKKTNLEADQLQFGRIGIGALND